MKEHILSKKTKVIMIVLISIITVLLVYNGISSNLKGKVENTVAEEVETNWVNPNLITDLEELSSKSALDRMKYYVDKFLFYIEAREFETAYQLLHDDFKQEHFPTLDEFKTYVLKKYPVISSVSYDGYDRLGNYYILTVTVSDIINATENYTPQFTQKFVIMENGLNNFKMSFQAEF